MRTPIALLSLLTLLVALAAAGLAGASTEATTFKYCTDPTFPPMELASPSGAISGFDVDMASALAKTWGASSKPVKTPFPGLIPALNAKKCDAVISGIFVTPDRLKQAPAVIYMETHRVLIVKNGNPKHVSGPNGLKGLNVAVQAGRSTRSTSRRSSRRSASTCRATPATTTPSRR